jgi:hypothetical protein
MITDAILSIVYLFVSGITVLLSSLGEVSATNTITDGIVSIKTYYNSLASFLPITTILAIVAFDLAFEGFVFTYKMIRWGYQKVPMIN